MAEELQESEVVFSDRDRDRFRYLRRKEDDDDHEEEDYFDFKFNYSRRRMVAASRREYRTVRDGRQSKKEMASSLPVGIPESVTRRMAEEDETDEEDMIPPHVMAERRMAGNMAFSVCTGNGRTLKGRDLSRVRNSVLRMTGFLET